MAMMSILLASMGCETWSQDVMGIRILALECVSSLSSKLRAAVLTIMSSLAFGGVYAER